MSQNIWASDLIFYWPKKFSGTALDNVKSSTTSVDSGVPQGTVLGPLLFLLYINDFPENVKAYVKLFADDCLLYKEINNISDGQNLQNDLKALEFWGK